MDTDTFPDEPDDRDARRQAEFIESCLRPPLDEPSSILTGRIMYIATDNAKNGFWPLFPAKVEK